GRGAFQDGSGSGMNDVGLMRAVTAFAQEVPAIGLLPHHLHVALRTMVGDEPRPVFLSVPQDLHDEPVTEPYRPLQYGLGNSPRVLDRQAAADMRTLLATGPRIAVLAGNRCVRSGATQDLLNLAKAYGMPAVTVQVDSDPCVFGRDYAVTGSVVGDASTFVRWMLEDEAMGKALAASRAARDAWTARIFKMPRIYDADNANSEAVPIHPARA